jgi:hypothetical protein
MYASASNLVCGARNRLAYTEPDHARAFTVDTAQQNTNVITSFTTIQRRGTISTPVRVVV